MCKHGLKERIINGEVERSRSLLGWGGGECLLSGGARRGNIGAGRESRGKEY